MSQIQSMSEKHRLSKKIFHIIKNFAVSVLLLSLSAFGPAPCSGWAAPWAGSTGLGLLWSYMFWLNRCIISGRILKFAQDLPRRLRPWCIARIASTIGIARWFRNFDFTTPMTLKRRSTVALEIGRQSRIDGNAFVWIGYLRMIL